MPATSLTGTSFKKFLFLLCLGLAMTCITGLVYGYVSQRWGPAPDLIAAGKHLETFPAQFGDWQLVRDEPMKESVIEVLSCAGYVNRQYVNRRTGDTVSIAITVGPAGPISVHTPEICYSSQAYSIQETRRLTILSDKNGEPHSFWGISFRSNNTIADQLCVYYAWTAEKAWKAVESPRFEFAGRPILYKLQLSSLVAPEVAAKADNPCKAFLTDLLRSGWNVSA
jgi:Protein of unknown function (DUF3485)